MSLPRRFVRSVLTTYLRIGSSVLLALVVTPILVDGLGKTEFGVWALAGSIIVYIEFLDLGFAAATAKWVADYAALGDERRLRQVIVTSFWLLAVPGLLALGSAVGLAAAFPALFDVPPEIEDAARVLVFLIAVDLAVSIPADVFGAALVGLQRYDLLNATLVAGALALAVAWTLVIVLGGGLVALGVVTLVINLLGQLSRYLLARRLVPGLGISPRDFDRGLVRRLAALSGWLAIGQGAVAVIQRSGPLVAGLVAGVSGAAVFAVAQKLGVLAERMVLPATQTFFPHSAELVARKDFAGLRSTVVAGTRISLAIAGPVCLALILLAEPALEAWVGAEYVEGATVVALLAAATGVKALTETGRDVLSGAGLPRVPAYTATVEAVLSVVLGLALGAAFGIEGVALGAFIAAAAANLGILLPYLSRRLAVSLRSLLAALAPPHLAAAAASVAVGALFLALGVSGPLVIPAGLGIAATYVLAFAALGLDPGERRRIAGLIQQRWTDA